MVLLLSPIPFLGVHGTLSPSPPQHYYAREHDVSQGEHATGHQESSTEPEYRLLVSRGTTQRLHSPCLGAGKDEEHWVLQDRLTSQQRVKENLRRLGVQWKQYVADVAALEAEMHVLDQKAYAGAVEAERQGEGGMADGVAAKNMAAVEENKGMVYGKGSIGGAHLGGAVMMDKETANEKGHVRMLRVLGRARRVGEGG